MPYRTHPELAKLFAGLTACTCAACLVQDFTLANKDALIETFESLARNAGHIAYDTCAVCHTHKAVICPNPSA